MLQTLKKSGFTLIELLVVITIIGILATGATTVYTSQIQKARDTTRVNDIKALQAGIEQSYQDKGTYPNAGLDIGTSQQGFADVTQYTPKLPKDPKTGQKSTNSNFDYTYAVAGDTNGIPGQSYEVSTTFENSGNIDSKAEGDGGTDDFRLEQGTGVDTALSPANIAVASLPATWVGTGTPIGASCIVAAGTSTATCPSAVVQSTANAATLVIR